jgi:mycothiol S-conjugate amidase
MTGDRRLMFVHAHPDDESSKGAATAARYVDEGVRVTLVTCTDGAAGEVLNPSFDTAMLDAVPLARIRADELADAVRAIGFSATYALDFADSGWHEDAASVPSGTFARMELDIAAAALATVVRTERPHVVVTYAEDGGYPHPDHIMNHLVTMRALELAASPSGDAAGVVAGAAPAWSVAKVYAASAFPRERIVALHEAQLAAGMESTHEEWLATRRDDEPGPDTRVRCDAWFARRDAALRAHASQVDPDGDWFDVPVEAERAAYPWEAYQLLESRVMTVLPEDDLFAGIDVVAWDAAQATSHAEEVER